MSCVLEGVGGEGFAVLGISLGTIAMFEATLDKRVKISVSGRFGVFQNPTMLALYISIRRNKVPLNIPCLLMESTESKRYTRWIKIL